MMGQDNLIKEEFTLSDNKPFKVYSNEVSLAFSSFDITMQYKHNTPDESELLGTISLSPQHAKALAIVLTQNVAQYEEMFGILAEPNKEAVKKEQDKGIIKVGS